MFVEHDGLRLDKRGRRLRARPTDRARDRHARLGAVTEAVRFPASERIVFANNPLAEVICQLRFPTILGIATEPPAAFQETVRAAYPVYRRDDGSVVPPAVAQIIGQVAMPTLPEAVTHWFDSADGNRSISLGPQFVAVTERAYTEWRDLREGIELATGALAATYSPAFFERVGLRYQDVIERTTLGLEQFSWSALLIEPLAGLLGSPADVSEGIEQARSVARLTLDEPEGAQVLLQTALDGPQRFVIDADFFVEQRKDGDAASSALDTFNVEAGRLFRWAIKQPLRDALGRRDG